MSSSILRTLIPSQYTCMVCYRELPRANVRSLCADCCKKLPYVTSPCEKCGKQINEKHRLCEGCAKEKRDFVLNRSAFCYSGEIRQAYLRFKFGEKRYTAFFFAQFIKDVYYQYGYECDGVVAVAGYKKKRFQGRNHAELLARAVAKTLGLPYLNGLYKKQGRKQVGLSGIERRKNIEGAFYVQGDAFYKKRVLVVDDVFTTGSTMNEVAKTLRKEGKAKEVYGLTLFNVVDP